MAKTSFEEAWKTGEIDESFIEMILCPACRWTKGELKNDTTSLCEGVYCEETYDKIMEDLYEK